MDTINRENYENAPVVIIGAGVCGLALATFLKRNGIEVVILERRDRAYIEQRQRAGVVDARAVEMFERWGIADLLLAGPVAQIIEYRINGEARVFDASVEDGVQSRFCTQQMLVNKLMKVLIDEMSGDVRFNVSDIEIENTPDASPSLTYMNDKSIMKINCRFIAGCDADRGVSRASVPDGVIKTFSYDCSHRSFLLRCTRKLFALIRSSW